MKNIVMLAVLCLLGSGAAQAAVVHEIVTFEQDGTLLEGYLAWDDALEGSRPGVLVVHQWKGLSDNERMRADMLAELGYMAFATDIYGQGIRPANSAEASAEAGKYYGDLSLYRARLQAGLDELKRQPGVDPNRLAAIGYCFGGKGVLELARSGADLAGVVSFHGNLDTAMPAEDEDVKAKVLVCHGAVDPFVKPEAVQAFLSEMEAVNVDYQLIMYAGAVHAFTQKGAGNDPSKGAAYNEVADHRSWIAMKNFFEEIF